MKNMLTKVFAVFVGLSLLCMTAKTQDFCDSYLMNDYKLIVYNNRYTNDFLFIVGSEYWELRVRKNSTDLEFKTEDRLPVNSSSLLRERYSFAIQTTNPKKEMPNISEPAFYDPKTNTFNVFRYENKIFESIKANVKIDATLDFSAFTFGFHIENRIYSKRMHTLNGMIVQRFDEKSHTFIREFVYKWFRNDLKFKAMTLIGDDFYKNHEKLMLIDKSYEMKGILVFKKSFYVLFRFDSTIKYCLINECSKDLRLLIDCKQRPETDGKTMLYVKIGIPTVIGVILIVVIITLCVRAYRKRQKGKRETNSRTDSKTTVFGVDAQDGSITQDLKKMSGKKLGIAQFRSDMNIDPPKKLKSKKKKEKNENKKGQTLKSVKPNGVPTKTTTNPKSVTPKK